MNGHIQGLLEVGPLLLTAEGEPIWSAFQEAKVYLKQVNGWGEEETIMYLRLAFDWAKSGFASVDMGHKKAAALICTSASSELVDTLKIPWPAFLIIVPQGLGLSINSIIVSVRANGVYGQFITDKVNITFQAASFSELVTRYDDSQVTNYRPDLDRPEDREMLSALRLLVSTLFDITRYRESHSNNQYSAIKTKHGIAKRNTFKLVNDINIDVRQAVKDYITSGKQHPTVQSLVRGHFKNQPCGIRLQARKILWIEPYWRGPETTPVAVRVHRLES